ncbi:unnamed protein product, partial [Darwinula stevensoni]
HNIQEEMSETQQIKIIQASLSDIEELQNIGRQTFFDTFAPYNSEANMQKYLEEKFSAEKLACELADENSVFYFASLENEVVGYLKLNFGPAQTELNDGKALEIERIYVLEAFHGKKVGQVLYQKAIEIAKQKNMEYVWLGVWEQNTRALNFYKKNGFVEFDTHLFVLGDEMRIVFMGTPEFAVPSLQILVENGYEVVGVVTMPDKPGGRLGTIESPVKKYALSQGLKVMQPPKLKNPEFLEELRALRADLQVVVAFRMLPEVVWNMPPNGTINLHGSLLPKFRGAAPLNWAVISGAKETGLTTFRLTHEIDTGDVFFREKVTILDTDTAGTLHDKMMPIGAELVLRTVQAIERGVYKLLPQSHAKATLAPKIFTNDCIIDFNKPVRKVFNFIRGMSPYPGAFTILDESIFKILSVRMEEIKPSHRIGTFVSDGKSYLRIACKGGYILADEVQMEGKRRLA